MGNADAPKYASRATARGNTVVDQSSETRLGGYPIE
jgi:hypothetical protein